MPSLGLPSGLDGWTVATRMDQSLQLFELRHVGAPLRKAGPGGLRFHAETE